MVSTRKCWSCRVFRKTKVNIISVKICGKIVYMKYFFLSIIILLNICTFKNVNAETELLVDYQGTYKAKILNISNEREEDVGFGDTTATYKTVEVMFLDGPKKDQAIVLETDFPNINVGQKVYINYNIHSGTEVFTITNIDRVGAILFFILLFIIAVIMFGGWQGVRSIISLFFSFVAIIYVLMPILLKGYNPILSSFLIAAAILFLAIFFTHGFNKESTVSYVGTMVSVLLTSVLAMAAVKITHLTGFIGEESTYLNMNTGGTLNFSGLLLAGIIVGVLGVLDDIAITQASVVTELFNTDKSLTRRQVYIKAIRVGKEHVSALVNTLILAYVGTSLPLLLLIKTYGYDMQTVLNMEGISTEIIRAIVGSIGLIMTVPIVTLLAVFYLKNYHNPKSHGHVHSHHGHNH